MQRFINNWETELSAPLNASDGALRVPAALAQRLEFAPGDFYDLTLDPSGAVPEIVRVTAVSGGSLTLGARALEGSATPASWPAGTRVVAPITAGCLAALQQSAGGGSPGRGVLVPGGPSSIPADTVLIEATSMGADAQVTLPAPPEGGAYLMDLRMYNWSHTALTLIPPAGGQIGIADISDCSLDLQPGRVVIAAQTRPKWARVVITNYPGEGVYVDVAEYYTGGVLNPPEVPGTGVPS